MKKAFSLIELMIVIVILGLLAGFILPNLIGKSEEAKNKLSCIQMKSIEQIIKMYRIDHSNYPTTEQGLEILKEKKYFDKNKIPKDSWNENFIYIFDTQNNSYEIISKGSDLKENTDDDIYLSRCGK